MENAGGEGTIAHELIDGYWKGEKYDISQKPEKVQQYLLAFEEFVKQHNPKVIETEGVVFSDTHKYAGAYDGLFEIAGETWLIDWKTSNGIYKEHKIQIIAYKKALEEMGKKVDKVAIVQLKNNGLPNTYMVGEQEDEVDVFDAFLCALKLYQVLDQLK
jgi:predicted RecB family nuclease